MRGSSGRMWAKSAWALTPFRSAGGQASHAAMPVPAVNWMAAPAFFPPGARFAVLQGDPSQTGVYTVRLEMPAGYVIPPHSNERHDVSLRLRRIADGVPEPSPPVEIIFSDASGGRFWRRDRYGGLSEIKGTLPPSGLAHFFRDPTNTL